MIVDDEEDMRTILTMALSQKYEVFEATNGLDAMLKIDQYQPDVAIIDMMMPLMNGFDLSKKIRNKENFKDMPILALSALNSSQDIKSGYQHGADLYLTKPFKPDRVDKSLQIVLEGKAPRKKDLPIEEVAKRESELAETRARKKQREETGKLGNVDKETNKSTAQPYVKKEAAPQAQPSVNPTKGKPRILLVDDDEDFLLIGRSILETKYEVVIASNGMEAINKIPLVQPDLFVLDGMMPKMSGYQMLDMLHQSTETNHIPVIFASAKSDPRDKKLVMSKGVIAYLVKPFSDRILLDNVSKVTQQPGFKIRPKTHTIQEVLYREGVSRANKTNMSGAKQRWQTNAKFSELLKDDKK